jgi:hypothetical protein
MRLLMPLEDTRYAAAAGALPPAAQLHHFEDETIQVGAKRANSGAHFARLRFMSLAKRTAFSSL